MMVSILRTGCKVRVVCYISFIFLNLSSGLASFTGMLFRRYNATLSPILRYIVHQLQNGQTTEIVVLRELIWKMAGIEPLPSFSDTQIQAMAGGPALCIEAIASSTRGARMDPLDGIRFSQRLGQALIETSLALPLLIQVAQQRQSSVFLARDAPLKSLAGLFDMVRSAISMIEYPTHITCRRMVSCFNIWTFSQHLL